MSYRVEMVCGPDGCKRAVVALEDDAPRNVVRLPDGVMLGCQLSPPRRLESTGEAMDEFCIKIPEGLLRKLLEDAGS